MIVEISMSHINQYFEDAIKILKEIDKSQIEKIICKHPLFWGQSKLEFFYA